MVKKIVQLEDSEGNQIYPVSATGTALTVTLNADFTWSGATTLEMENAMRSGTPVVLQGPILDSGHALLLSMNGGVRTSWGTFVQQDSGILYRLVFDDSNSTWHVQAMTGNSYSTSEQTTYDDWVDGKIIYKKTINVGALPNNTTKNVDPQISDLDQVIEITGVATDGTVTIPLPNVGASAAAGVALSVGTNGISITCGQDRSSFQGYVTLHYTKTVQ